MVKKQKQKGFTLVELIVVLVILSILAALLVPSLTGYIEKTHKTKVLAETRMVHTAVQTTVSEYYGTDKWAKYGEYLGQDSEALKDKYYLADKNASTATEDGKEKKARYDQIVKLAEVSESKCSFMGYFTQDGKVQLIIYKDGKGYVGIYFGETNEYIAYKEQELKNLAMYDGVMNTVQYIKKTEPDGSLNIFLQKEWTLANMGYTASGS
ncbi:type II secretion system protein [uncultured Gemmiger sp.]|uniref:type II secretion system protein n=1 Tax=uncultured Gemmiger sp. TaxID=1623490 RepID=UPI0025CE2CEA|nr:type II secretion system protein [uncultured Gemmiger sp.]